MYLLQHKKGHQPFWFFYVIAVLILTASCKNIGDDITTNSATITKEFTITDYSILRFGVPFSLYYTSAVTPKLQIEASPEILDYIAIHQNTDELSIQLAKKINLANIKPVRIYASSSSIQQIINEQIGVVFVQDSINASQLTILLSNNGKIVIQKLRSQTLMCTTYGSGELYVNGGFSDSVFITHNSTGKTNLSALSSKFNQTNLNGNGIVSIAVQDTLSATINGDGSIQYIGDPAIFQKIIGKGRIIKL